MQKSGERMKKGTAEAQLCFWGSLPGVFQEGWGPAWLSQVCERWEVVGSGGLGERDIEGRRN